VGPPRFSSNRGVAILCRSRAPVLHATIISSNPLRFVAISTGSSLAGRSFLHAQLPGVVPTRLLSRPPAGPFLLVTILVLLILVLPGSRAGFASLGGPGELTFQPVAMTEPGESKGEDDTGQEEGAEGNEAQAPPQEESTDQVAATPPTPDELRKELLRATDAAPVAVRVGELLDPGSQETDGVVRSLLVPETPEPILRGVLTAIHLKKVDRFLSELAALYGRDERPEVRKHIVAAVKVPSTDQALTALATLASDKAQIDDARRGAVNLLGSLAIPERVVVATLIDLLRADELLFRNSPSVVAQALEKITRSRVRSRSEWLAYWDEVQGLGRADYWGHVLGRLDGRLTTAESRAVEGWRQLAEELKGRKDAPERYVKLLLDGVRDTTSGEIRRASARLFKEPRLQSSTKQPEIARILLSVLREGDPEIAADVAEALVAPSLPAELQGEVADAARTLVTRLKEASEPSVRRSLIKALGSLAQGEVVTDLLALLETEPDPLVLVDVVHALGALGRKEALAPLVTVLEKTSSGSSEATSALRQAAAISLGMLGDRAAVDPLGRALTSDAELRVRYRAAEALAALQRRVPEVRNQVALQVSQGLADPEKEVRKRCAGILREIASPVVVEDLLKALADPDAEVRLATVQALARVAPALTESQTVQTALMGRFKDASPAVASEAIASVADLVRADVARSLGILDEVASGGDLPSATLLGASLVESDGITPETAPRAVVKKVLDLLVLAGGQSDLQRALDYCRVLLRGAPIGEEVGLRIQEASLETSIGQPERALQLLQDLVRDAESRPEVSTGLRGEIDYEISRAELRRAIASGHLADMLKIETGINSQVSGIDPSRSGRMRQLADRAREVISARVEKLLQQVRSGDDAAAAELASTPQRSARELMRMLEAQEGESALRETAWQALRRVLSADAAFPSGFDPAASAEDRKAKVEEVRRWQERKPGN